MTFQTVHDSLRDLFPMVDDRALRAVAIEHINDVDAAVEAVLEEIIPFFTVRSAPTSPLTWSAIEGESSSGSSSVRTEFVDQADDDHSFVSEKEEPSSSAVVGLSGPIRDASAGHLEVEDDIAQLTLSVETHDDGIKMNSNIHSQAESLVVVGETREGTCHIEVLEDPRTEKTVTAEDETSCSSNAQPKMDCIQENKDDADGIARYMSASTTSEVEASDIEGSDLDEYDENDLDEYDESDLDEYDESDLDEYDESDLDESYESDLDESDGSDLDESDLSSSTTDSTSSGENMIDLGESDGRDLDESDGSDLDESDLSSSTDSGKNMSNTLGAEDETTLNSSICSQNGANIDHLEEIIADARNNKKTLFMEMETVINLMKQVEVKEHAAEQAKTEAARMEMDLQNEVKELKIMIKHAKEANDMHAGDVCGEKVILTTELRELHSRLVSLSDDRDKSLADLDEMRQCLEVRLAAADNEIKSAELKKVVNEKFGKQSLIEQKLIMAQVVQESKNLRQQAEDNAKLHAFLMDRGQLADTLQGEIAVICQDVKQLKEKFDLRLPLSRSLLSTQTSFLLASSNSSMKSLVPDQVEAVAIRDDDRSETGDHKKVPEDELASADRKALAEDDDGWVLFESSKVNGASSDDE